MKTVKILIAFVFITATIRIGDAFGAVLCRKYSCKELAAAILIDYSSDVGGGYRYLDGTYGGPGSAASWQWNLDGGGTSSGSFTNTAPYVNGRHWCASNNSGTPSGTGSYCWCQVSGINYSSANTCSDTPWVYVSFFVVDSYYDCSSECALYCAVCAKSNANGSCLRSALLALP